MPEVNEGQFCAGGMHSTVLQSCSLMILCEDDMREARHWRIYHFWGKFTLVVVTELYA